MLVAKNFNDNTNNNDNNHTWTNTLPLFWACQKIHECLNSNLDKLEVVLNSYWITSWQVDFAFTIAKAWIISTSTSSLQKNKSCNILFMMYNAFYFKNSHRNLHVSYTFNLCGTLQARNQISRLLVATGYHLGAFHEIPALCSRCESRFLLYIVVVLSISM